VATGKVLLAYDYDSLSAPISRTLEKFTPKTITAIKALDVEMKHIREAGLAINLGEYREDVGGIAAPITGLDGAVIAAIGISGPITRFPARKLKELSSLVVKSARDCSNSLRLGI
jgi:DNA-binding IclR family transcriptional regulator